MLKDLPLSEIIIDDTILLRPLDEGKAKEYAQDMRRGDRFPEPDVFFDGKAYRLADGRKRHYAAGLADRSAIECFVHDGGRREAIIFAALSNHTNGVPSSTEEKREAARRLLLDDEWREKSNREIARVTHLSHPTVVKMYKQMVKAGTIPERGKTRVKRGSQGYLVNLPDRPKPRKSKKKSDLTPEQKRTAKQAGESWNKQVSGAVKKPRTQPEIDRDEILEAMSVIRTSLVDGDHFVNEWGLASRLNEFDSCRKWFVDAVRACKTVRDAA